jgi:hypothetical protein
MQSGRLRAIGTAIGVVAVLVLLVASAMARIVRADIRTYNGQGSLVRLISLCC